MQPMLFRRSLKKEWTVLLFFCLGFSASAQQQGQYSQYMMNYFLINPAAAGTEHQVDIRAGYRRQWTGLSGSPQNYYLTGHAPLNRMYVRGIGKGKKRSAYHVVGGILSGQTLGALTHNTVYLSYAYHIPLSQKWTMSMGLIAGLNQFSLNRSKLDFGDYIPDVAAGNINKINPDLGAGLWLYSDKFFFGVSSMQIIQSKLGSSPNQLVRGVLDRLFYLTGGYNIQLSPVLSLVPSVLLKQTVTAFQMDLNAKMRYMNVFWAGISYRRIDAMSFMAGVLIPLSHQGNRRMRGGQSSETRLEIGYSYDLVTSRLGPYSYGSHEIMLAVILPMPGQLVCPSHFW